MEPVEHKTNFKGPRVSEKIRRRQKRITREATEKQNKDVVRSRDNKLRRGCSIPLCGCRKFQLAKHVAHLEHKGMGGNQAEDRSTPDKMIQVCVARHREHTIAIDRGTLKCRPLTAAGTNGPVSWWASLEDLPMVITDVEIIEDGFVELAREISPGVFAAFTAEQLEALEILADMEL